MDKKFFMPLLRSFVFCKMFYSQEHFFHFVMGFGSCQGFFHFGNIKNPFSFHKLVKTNKRMLAPVLQNTNWAKKLLML